MTTLPMVWHKPITLSGAFVDVTTNVPSYYARRPRNPEIIIEIQQKPLNQKNFGWTITENINRKIIIRKYLTYIRKVKSYQEVF